MAFAGLDSEILAAGIAISGAGALAALGFWANQRREREKATLTLLMTRFSNDAIRQARALIYDRLEDRKPITKPTLSNEEYHLVMNLLSFYEFIAISYLRNRLDRKAILRFSGGSIRQAYRACETMIAERRTVLERPNMFRDLEVMAVKHLKA